MKVLGAAPWGAFGALSFAYFASIGLFNPYAPLWFQALGFSPLAIGVLASLQSWTRVVTPYGWGWLSDHTGHKVWLLRVATLLTLLAGLGLTMARSYLWVAACVLILFLCNGGVVPLYESALARYLVTSEGLDAGRYGRIRVWGSIGFIVSVTMFGVLLQASGIDLFPWVVGAMLALLFITACRLPSRVDRGHETHEAGPALGAVLARPDVAWFFASIFFTVLAHTSLYTFLSLYLDSLGYGKAAVGLMWAASVVMEIAFFWGQGSWFHRYTPWHWLMAAAVLTVLRLLSIAQFGHVPAVLVAAQLLHAFTFAGHHAACTAMLSRYFPGRLRGRGQALYSTLGYGFSGVIGGVGGGMLTEHWGYGSVFWAGAAAALLACGCCLRMRRHELDQVSSPEHEA